MASNWTGGLPTSGYTTVIANGGTAIVNSTVPKCGYLSVGSTEGSGTLLVTGGSLSTTYQYVGDYYGTGDVIQSSGVNSANLVFLADWVGSSGTYELTGGLLSTGSLCTGAGAARVTQSGGTISTSFLTLGNGAGNRDTGQVFSLSGSGLLSAGEENLWAIGGTGVFQQTGGTNTARFLQIGTKYVFTGGTLQISGGLQNQGTFDAGGKAVAISFHGSNIVDFSTGTIVNAQSASLMVGANSLVLASPGFDPASVFGTYSNAGLTHVVGTTLSVPAGQGFGGEGTITDFVNCQGTIAAVPGGRIRLTNGLVVSGMGNVDLGASGTLGVNDTISGMSSGTLSTCISYVGSLATGAFTQSGGIHTASGKLSLGGNSGKSGTYSLTGGQLSGGSEVIGELGTGRFTQSGGTNSMDWLSIGYNDSGTYTLTDGALFCAKGVEVGYVGTGTFTQSGATHTASGLILGSLSGSNGTYNLSGGTLSVAQSVIGENGNGTFVQTGGTHTIANRLILAEEPGSTGTYNLSGGTLIVSSIARGSGSASFNFNGGTLQAGRTFSAALPVALNTGGGNATFDTDSYTVTLSGVLSGPGNLIKTGSGTLALSATNTYGGSTRVNAGILTLAGSLNSSTALAVNGGTFSYAPTANGGIGNSQIIAGLTINAGASGINATVGNTLTLGTITRNTGGAVNFNNNTAGTITTTQANTNGILGPWATYGSGASMSYATASGSSGPHTVTPYTGATAVTSGVSGLSDTTGTINYAISGGGGTLAAAVNSNTIQFTGAANSITASATTPLSLNGIMNVGSGTVTITGGDLVIGNAKELVLTGPGNVTVESIIRDSGTGASALTMAGSGTLTLSAANTYTGPTTVNGGSLFVHGTHSGGGLYMVASGATLGGTGTIGSGVDLEAGARLVPGPGPATLTLGSLSMKSGSLLDLDLNQSGIVGQGVNDLIIVQGSVLLDGILGINTLEHVGPGSYTLLTYGDTATYRSLRIESNPAFVCPSEVSQGAYARSSTILLGSGTSAYYAYALEFAPNGSGGENINLIVASVPEPLTIVLLGTGALGLLLYTWRRSDRRADQIGAGQGEAAEQS